MLQQWYFECHICKLSSHKLYFIPSFASCLVFLFLLGAMTVKKTNLQPIKSTSCIKYSGILEKVRTAESKEKTVSALELP